MSGTSSRDTLFTPSLAPIIGGFVDCGRCLCSGTGYGSSLNSRFSKLSSSFWLFLARSLVYFSSSTSNFEFVFECCTISGFSLIVARLSWVMTSWLLSMSILAVARVSRAFFDFIGYEDGGPEFFCSSRSHPSLSLELSRVLFCSKSSCTSPFS